jgi:molecular chaperone GrpE
LKHERRDARAAHAARPESATPDPAALDAEAPGAESDLALRTAELAAELARVKDERLRAEADLQNVRRRAARESEEAERRGEARAFGALLSLIDDLERARAAAPGEGPLAEGVAMVLLRAMDELSRLGITAIDPQGAPFDPREHEALLSGDSGEHPAGTVSQVIARGYRHGDRLLRPARVAVSTGTRDGGESAT